MGEMTKKRMRFRRVVLAATVLVSLFILMAGLALAAWHAREDSISQELYWVSAYADVAASVSGPEYVAVVWSEGDEGHPGALQLRWGPPGEEWKWPITMIENNDSQSREPAVAVSGSTAYIAYTKRSGDNWIIGYAECQYESSCVTDTVRGSTTEVGSADIALCGNTRYVVWANTTTGTDDDIWYSSSTDGTSWTGPTQVSNSVPDDSSPSIACDGGTAHVSWIQDDSGAESVMYASSNNWGAKTTVWPAGTNIPYNTSIAAYGNYVDVVWDWSTSGNYHVYQWRKILSGGSCTNEIPDASTYYTSTDSGAEYMRYLQPAIAIYNDTAYAQPVPAVVWHADVNDTYEVMYSYGAGFSGACDVTWSDPISLTSDFGLFKNSCSAPSIAIGASGTVTHTHVVFQYDEPDDPHTSSEEEWEIYYTSDISSTLTQEESEHPGVYLPIILKSY